MEGETVVQDHSFRVFGQRAERREDWHCPSDMHESVVAKICDERETVACFGSKEEEQNRRSIDY
jgi:hypothetical protein